MTETITKRPAATAQIETAIKLFFENRDLISAFTLTAAADGILEGIWSNEREIHFNDVQQMVKRYAVLSAKSGALDLILISPGVKDLATYTSTKIFSSMPTAIMIKK